MEKIDKALEILQAFKDGKTIEYFDTEEQKWNYMDNENFILQSLHCRQVRIKPGPSYRPYKDAEEFLSASKEHGPYLKNLKFENLFMPIVIGTSFIIPGTEGKNRGSFDDIIKKAVWQDGTPCGILEK